MALVSAHSVAAVSPGRIDPSGATRSAPGVLLKAVRLVEDEGAGLGALSGADLLTEERSLAWEGGPAPGVTAACCGALPGAWQEFN